VELGVADGLIDPRRDRVDQAVEFALRPGLATRPIRALPVRDAATADAALEQLLKKVQARRHGQIAPRHIINAVRASFTAPSFETGLRTEGEEFGVLLASPEARALQHVFFAERAAAKIAPQYKAEPRKITKVGVVGAGTMGGGIAMCCANVGIPVILVDVSAEGLNKGLAVVKKNYARSVQRGSITQEQMDRRVGLIAGTVDYASLSQVDLVIEAVFEDLSLKKKVFAQLDAVCPAHCVLATNTSYLDIDDIASATKRPASVVGAHFFSPANVMRLLEVVRGCKSSPVTISTMMAFGKRIKKLSVLAGNCDGFVGNRMVTSYSAEARALVLEGAGIEQVDAAVGRSGFGYGIGPFQMADIVGLAMFHRMRKSRGLDDRFRSLDDALCEAGRHGQQNGLGYYSYKDNPRVGKADPAVAALARDVAASNGVRRRLQITEREIQDRLLLPLINEGFKILEEGIASKASDIDMIKINGYSFPGAKGGPMQYAKEIGYAKVLVGLQRYPNTMGVTTGSKPWWRPSQLLVECARTGVDPDVILARRDAILRPPKANL